MKYYLENFSENERKVITVSLDLCCANPVSILDSLFNTVRYHYDHWDYLTYDDIFRLSVAVDRLIEDFKQLDLSSVFHDYYFDIYCEANDFSNKLSTMIGEDQSEDREEPEQDEDQSEDNKELEQDEAKSEDREEPELDEDQSEDNKELEQDEAQSEDNKDTLLYAHLLFADMKEKVVSFNPSDGLCINYVMQAYNYFLQQDTSINYVVINPFNFSNDSETGLIKIIIDKYKREIDYGVFTHDDEELPF